MLIKRTPDVYEKIGILGGMAGDDLLTPSQAGSGSQGKGAAKGMTGPYSRPSKRPLAGVYRAAMPNGKFMNMMRVMFTDFCMMDCAYCPNSIYVPRKRYAFKVEELASAFMEMHRRHTVAGLFLSSGIAGSGSKTTERMVQVVEVLRRKHNFRGYVHLKVMPGAEFQYVEAAHRLGTRLSINIETPTAGAMKRISPHKDFDNGILAPMSWIDQLNQSTTGGAVGQVTQFVVGAAEESDADILRRVDQLYSDWDLKRVYYAAFRPASDTPMEEHPPVPPVREHRLYQMDWLKRIYRYSNQELDLAFGRGGFLPLDQDPKTSIALENLDSFPVDLNSASREQLLRVPGLGPTSAQTILENRQRHSIDNWRDLQAMGVVRKRAWPFVVFPGQRPPSGKQLKLELFPEGAKEAALSGPVPAASEGTAPCGLAASCSGCALREMPGHPA